MSLALSEPQFLVCFMRRVVSNIPALIHSPPTHLAPSPRHYQVPRRWQRELRTNSLICPAEGDGDQPGLGPFHPEALRRLPARTRGSLVIRAVSLAPAGTRYLRQPGPSPGSGWEPGEPFALTQTWPGWDARILLANLGGAEGKNWFGRRHIFFVPALGLSVGNHPGAVDSSQQKPGGVAGREQDGGRASSPRGLPACRRGAALASAAGALQSRRRQPPSQKNSTACGRAGAGAACGRGLWFRRRTLACRGSSPGPHSVAMETVASRQPG